MSSARGCGSFAGARRWAEVQLLTARERRFAKVRIRRPIACGPAEERDLVANLDRDVLLPASALEHVGRIAFEPPVDDLAARIFHVDVDVRVRVGPVDLGDGTGQVDGLRGIERDAEGMMCG